MRNLAMTKTSIMFDLCSFLKRDHLLRAIYDPTGAIFKRFQKVRQRTVFTLDIPTHFRERYLHCVTALHSLCMRILIRTSSDVLEVPPSQCYLRAHPTQIFSNVVCLLFCFLNKPGEIGFSIPWVDIECGLTERFPLCNGSSKGEWDPHSESEEKETRTKSNEESSKDHVIDWPVQTILIRFHYHCYSHRFILCIV